MHRPRLLERVSRRERVGAPRQAPSAELLDSVLAHLSRVLNTRQGSVPMDPQFGVGDFGNLGSGTSAGDTGDIEARLQTTIERYEPRLLHPRVRLCRDRSDALSMSFSLEAAFAPDRREQSLSLLTRIDAQGRVRVDDEAGAFAFDPASGADPARSPPR